MRRSLLVVAAVVGTSALFSPLQAQTRNWELWLGGGPVIPIGELADEARTGLGLQGSLLNELPGLPVRLRADLFYHDAEAVAREPGIDVSLGGEWYRQIGAALYAQLSLPLGSLSPYGLVGGSWVREWHGDRTFRDEKQNSINLNAGVGIEFPIFGIGGFLEARYLNILGSDALPTGPPALHRQVEFRSIPVTFGIRL